MAKYVVTGGAGFIGSHVADMLVSGGHKVLILDNFSTGKREYVSHLDSEVLECDIRNDGDVLKSLSRFKPDGIVHMAAQPAITQAWRNPYTDLSVNGMGTLTMLLAAKKFNVDRFVYASTSAVYGDKRIMGMKEGTPRRPDNPYGVSKLVGEMYTRVVDVSTTVLRFGNVYGPRQVPIGENQVIARMMRHLIKGDEFYIFGDGKQKRDFIYVEDVARAVVKALTGLPGTYNIAGGQSVSVNQVAMTVADACGIPTYRWDYDYRRRDERKNVRLMIELAKEKLDWEPGVELAVGIRETLEWWKSQ